MPRQPTGFADVVAEVATLREALRDALEGVLPESSGGRACGRALGLKHNLGWKVYTVATSTDTPTVLRLLPRGTHEYAKLIKPSELAGHCRAAGLDLLHTRGLEYNPLTRRYWLSGDTSVNYMLATRKPG